MSFERRARVRLGISISKAHRLRAADFDFSFRGRGTSDPYATAWVKSRPLTEIRTETIPSTCDPVWNFTGVIERCPHGDPIEFQVWDSDRLGSDDILGRAEVGFDTFYPNGYDGMLTLNQTGQKVESFLEVRIDVLPPLPADTEEKPRCFVMVERAAGLKAADVGGASDPYCLVRCFGKKSFWRTMVIPKTLNPEWREEDEVPDFELGDDLEFLIYDWDRNSADDELGKVVLSASDFTPDGFSGTLNLRGASKKKGTVTVRVELDLPPPPKPVDPAAHVTADDRRPAPFQLRCLDTGRTQRLACYTVIGRSKKYLDPRYDLILDSPGICDVARIEHAVIKCWCGADPTSWRARVYNFQMGRGAGLGAGGGHAAGGTSVDNDPVRDDNGVDVEPGSILRFGVREMWVMERAVLHQKSRTGEVACQRARQSAMEDPGSFRELKVPSGACNHALQHCSDWDSLVRVVLEWCGEPDEPPCVDIIEVCDECNISAGRWEARTLEEQEAFDMGAVLREVRMGCTIRLRLSADPCLLAPILRKTQAHTKSMQDLHNTRGQELFSGFG